MCLDVILVSEQPESQFRNIQGNHFSLLSHPIPLDKMKNGGPFWLAILTLHFFKPVALSGLLLLSLRPDGFPTQNC